MSELNIKSSTLEKGLEVVSGFLKTIIGKPAEEFGLMLADNVKLWRLNNQIRNLKKVQKICEKAKIKTKQVDLKVLMPYLESVSLEENDELQNLWANLFVNYIDSNKNLATHVYPSILSQLSSDEVKLLKYFVNNLTLPIESERSFETWKKTADEPKLRNLI